MSGKAPCGCPADGGVIRHVAQTCTDPVVAKLGWYADPPEDVRHDVGGWISGPSMDPGQVPAGRSEHGERDYQAAVRIRDRTEDLNVYLASWQDRSHDGAARRQALTDAVGAIDLILRSAYDLRQSLVTQARQFDDEALRVADALLERLRKDGAS